jgi:hypothetical protein
MTNVALLGSFGDVSGSPLVFRNKLINGGMAVDQRNSGATQTFTAAAALAYSVDRWYGYCTGANATGARVAGTGSQYAYRFTGAASVTAIGFAQRIEQVNSYSLAGQTATLSVDLANSLLTTVTWTAYYANTADTFGSLASPTKTSIATGTFTVTSTVTRYQAQITVPAAATTGIEILFTVGAQTSGTWTIQNAQLEAGSSPTPFEQRPIGMELGLCQRYFQFNSSTTSIDAVFAMGLIYTSTRAIGLYQFSSPMRLIPGSISTVGSFQTLSNNTSQSASAVSFTLNSNFSSQIELTITGGVLGQAFLARAAAINSAILVSAEL